MDSNKPHFMMAAGWVLGLLAWVFHNFSTVLSVSVALAAITASLYSALANRAKKNFYEKEAALLDSHNLDKELPE